MTKQFRKKPITIEAQQWTGHNLPELIQWGAPVTLLPASDNALIIGTLEDGPNCEAVHVATVNDWILRGVQGEFYPVKPDIFAQTYEKLGLGEAASPASTLSVCGECGLEWRGNYTDCPSCLAQAGMKGIADCQAELYALREAVSLAPLSGWRPIETAPKDETPVLVCEPIGWRCVAQFREGRWMPWAPEGREIRCEPLWWQPLPAPPVVLADQEPK